MKRAQWVLGLSFLLVIVLGSGCHREADQGQAAPQVASRHGHNHSDQSTDIFTEPTVLRIDLEIPRAGMSALRRTQWGGGSGEERPKAKATVLEGGDVYTNVAVHLKGAAGSFRPVDDRPALTLNFDKFVPGQSFHGLHKISLNNSVQDPSLLSEKICRELFDAAGVPVPRAAHAWVKLNGHDLGMYVLLEGANKQFLKRYFKNVSGNLYDGGFVRDVDESLSVNCGDHPEDRSDLKGLLAVLRHRNRDLAPLEKVLDMNRFISMLAMEVMLVHWDGYGLNKNNWRLFHDVDTDKMVFIPHGLDQTFGVGRGGRFGIHGGGWSGIAARAVMQTAEGSRRYDRRFAELYTNVFKVDQICARIDQIEAALLPVLAEADPQMARQQRAQAAWFKQRVVRRGDEIARELGRPLNPVKFGSDGILHLTGWKPSTVKKGDPKLMESKDARGASLLQIRAGGPGASSGSWRTRTTIPSGQYEFQGRVRVTGVTADPADTLAGAGLRISKGVQPQKLAGTSDWREFSYPFQVEEDVGEIELICELRANAGEAAFDAASLRLVRQP